MERQRGILFLLLFAFLAKNIPLSEPSKESIKKEKKRKVRGGEDDRG
jgi:hypothetical protein